MARAYNRVKEIGDMGRGGNRRLDVPVALD